jgi:hypothetical protein
VRRDSNSYNSLKNTVLETVASQSSHSPINFLTTERDGIEPSFQDSESCVKPFHHLSITVLHGIGPCPKDSKSRVPPVHQRTITFQINPNFFTLFFTAFQETPSSSAIRDIFFVFNISVKSILFQSTF